LLPLRRLTAATEYLLSLIEGSTERLAGSAVSALGILSFDSSVAERAAIAVANRKSPSLIALFAEKFPSRD
jgi:hypothetical protein